MPGGELPGVTRRIVGRFTRWLADVWDRFRSQGGVNGAGVQRTFAFNPAMLDILARHHDTKPDVQRSAEADPEGFRGVSDWVGVKNGQ